MANLIKVVVNTLGLDALSPSESRWVNTKYITEMKIGNNNGAIFRYSPPYSPVPIEYRTDTAASDINTSSNA